MPSSRRISASRSNAASRLRSVRELHASNSQLQWVVDAYTLVFAGLLGLTPLGARIVSAVARPLGGGWVWQVLLGTLAQETYDTHPHLRAAVARDAGVQHLVVIALPPVAGGEDLDFAVAGEALVLDPAVERVVQRIRIGVRRDEVGEGHVLAIVPEGVVRRCAAPVVPR